MDNDQFNHLAQLSDIEFERERCRLIDEFLNSLPKEKRVEALKFQLRLDVRRETLPRDQFIASLFHDINENLENLSDQFVALGNLVFPKA